LWTKNTIGKNITIRLIVGYIRKVLKLKSAYGAGRGNMVVIFLPTPIIIGSIITTRRDRRLPVQKPDMVQQAVGAAKFAMMNLVFFLL
jgi:hypothetical protein